MAACDVDSLSRYLDGDLSPRERHQLALHLRACPACRAELALLRRLDGTIVAWGAHRAPVPDETERRIQESVNAQRKVSRFVAFSRMMPAAVGSSIAALLVLISANLGWLYQPASNLAQVDAAHVQRIVKSNSEPLQNARRLSAILGSQTQAPTQPQVLRHGHFNLE